MKEARLEELSKDKTAEVILKMIPNQLGINLCSVEDVDIVRTMRDEIMSIHITFIPENPTSDDELKSTVSCA